MENKRAQNRIQDYLSLLYGKDWAEDTWIQLKDILDSFKKKFPQLLDGSHLITLDSLDALLITYADQVQSPGRAHLQTLADFIGKHLKGVISAVHILPFFPYSSDDGFSVIDYKEVNSDVGNWEDLDPLRDCCQLMFDGVINHISSKSSWFLSYLQDQEPYQNYFLTVDPNTDLSQVVRPRAKPLLTKVNTPSGSKHVWTTFSEDQIDLNYQNPAVLLEIIDILLFYVQQGARLIRLDAIGFLWKEIGTTCSHLPQTHQVIKLLRAVLDEVAPRVILISETNVPHEENISYFGKPLPEDSEKYPLGDEAQMVYQFPLAPLVLHTFRSGNANVITNWSKSISVTYSSAAFLNFIASHDGIGVRPAEGLLSDDEIQGLVDQTLAHGGQVSYKTNQDGTQSVYELNITLFDMLNHPDTPLEVGLKRFMASQAIMLSLAGVPGIYIHSLFGSPNSYESVEETGRARSINRKKFHLEDIEKALSDEKSRTYQVFESYLHFLKVRKEQGSFNPLAPQEILEIDERVFGLLRFSDDGTERVLCLINISSESFTISVNKGINKHASGWIDLLSGENYTVDSIYLEPYQVLWLKEK